MRKLYPHQRTAMKYANKDADAIALFMKMRLGKSLVAIRWAKSRVDHGAPVLVVTPATTIHVWDRELKKEKITATQLVGSSTKKLQAIQDAWFDGSGDWHLVNPEGLRACPEIATALPWGLVILDETGGWFRNARAKTVKIITKLLGDIPNRAILTGEPDPAGPEDFFTQMRFAFGEFMGHTGYWGWRAEFMRPGMFGWELKPNSRRKIKMAVNELAFWMDEKKAGVFVPKVYERRYVTPPPSIRKAMREVKKEFSIGDKETKWSVVTSGWLAQLAGGSTPGGDFHPFKVDEVLRLVKGELRKSRIVIWCRFRREIEQLKETLVFTCNGHDFLLTGRTKQSERAEVLDSFAAGKFPVLIVQCMVGQYGLNVSHADAMIFYSNVYDWGIRAQCEKRLDHVEKKTPVLVVDLISEGTIDEAVIDTLEEKQGSSEYFAKRLGANARKRGLV